MPQNVINEAVRHGYRFVAAASPVRESNDPRIQRCDLCNNAVTPRGGGHVCHCHYCGQVLNTNNDG